jgi:flagellar protein FliO/FliZ
LLQSIQGGYQLKTLASVSLTSREKLCLVDVGGKHILVGVAPGHVSNIHVFDEPIEKMGVQSDTEPQIDFSSQLRQAIGWQTKQKE